MKTPERLAIVDQLPYESRIGFIAFCVERCIKEARRHPRATEQLKRLPLLSEGLDMLWSRIERGMAPDPGRLNAILEHLSTYESPADSEDMLYNYDVALVDTARILRRGLRMLQDPQAAIPRSVVGALDGPVQSVGGIYADYRSARNAEVAVIDSALLKLQELSSKPLSRAVFEGIPEWERGEISKKYAEDRIKGTAEDE